MHLLLRARLSVDSLSKFILVAQGVHEREGSAEQVQSVENIRQG
jgi:hypothetical protein